MNLLSRKWAVILLMAVPFCAHAQKIIELKDPSGKVQVNVAIGDEITYSVSHQGDVMIEMSPVSMTLTDGTVFGKAPRLKRKSFRTQQQTIYPPVYKKKTIEDHYNELTLDFKGGYKLVFRAYEDGAAYRFVSSLKKPFQVKSEQAVFNLPDNPKIFAATPKGRMIDGVENQYHSSFQNTYRQVALSEWDKSRLAFLPVLSEGKNGKKICITEADLLNYPGMFLNVSSDNKGFYGEFAAYPKDISVEVRGLKGMVKTREPYIAKVEGKTAFPWRVMVISENDTDLLCSDMVYKLATPAAEGDYSWIKPGKVAWDWWNDWNLYGVDFRAGINNPTYKYYIDFAAEHGIEYVILDEGWAVNLQADMMQVIPEIDLQELVDYGKSKNVGIILWAGYWAFARDMENVVKHYSDMGVKGFKVDFLDRDDQEMVNFVYEASEVCAKYKMLVDFHGVFKPTGLQRTYPNVLNYEGVNGLEQLKWSPESYDMVTYDVTIPFIRMIAGPMDYTQGAMRNAVKGNYRPVNSEPMSQGTRCRQLATYVIFESPFNMLCDAPSNYRREKECTEFISNIPTIWDETVSLDGKVSEYVAIARRHGNDWYIGALTNWTPRELDLDLSFLGEGDYTLELFKDGINADRAARDYKKEVIPVPTDRKLKIRMAPGGGYAARIQKR